MRYRRVEVTIALLLVLALVAVGCTGGESEQPKQQVSFPQKTVTLIAHSAPGSGSDLFARQVAKALEQIWGKPVVVESKVGGSGAIAISHVAQSAADGYTLLGVAPSMLQIPFMSKVPHTMDDLQPIAALVVDPVFIYVKADCPYKDMKELLEAAKQQTQKWGCPQPGSLEYITAVGLRDQYGYKIDPIPYSGGSEVLPNVLRGDLLLGMSEPAEIAGPLKAGEIRLVCALTSSGVDAYPDVPTLKDLGYDLGFEKYRGIVGPKGMSPDLVNLIADALKKVLSQQDFSSYAKSSAMQPRYLGPEDFARLIDSTKKMFADYYAKQTK